MTKSSEIRLSNTGVYFFGAPRKVTTQINHELLVVFRLPTLEACGFVLFGSEQEVKDLHEMLDILLQKTKEANQGALPQIEVKCFGVSHHHLSTVKAIQDWIKQNHLKVAVSDIGKNVSRHILVECKTGSVGVSYAESYATPSPPTFF